VHEDTTPRRIDQPEPGFFRMRLVKGGWLVPCQILCQRGLFWAVVDGTEHPKHHDPILAPWVARVWEGGQSTTETDYRWRLLMREWASQHHKRHPCLTPTRAISMMDMPVPSPPDQ
jgi:hypothetical protein